MINHSRHLVTRSGRWSGMLRSVLNWKLDTPSRRNTFQCHLIMKKSPRARFLIGETSWYLNIDSVFLYFSNQTHRVISAFCIYQLATSWMRHNFWEMFSVVTNILQCLGRGFWLIKKKKLKKKNHIMKWWVYQIQFTGNPFANGKWVGFPLDVVWAKTTEMDCQKKPREAQPRVCEFVWAHMWTSYDP